MLFPFVEANNQSNAELSVNSFGWWFVPILVGTQYRCTRLGTVLVLR